MTLVSTLVEPAHAGSVETASVHNSVVVVDIQGAIGVGTAYFLEQSLVEAQRRKARLVVIRLDTPGGLVSATRDIIRDILASPVPVAVYIAPSGARAASAGTYISYAAHFSAMAPGTHLGAATPIQVGAPDIPGRGPATGEKNKSGGSGSAMEQKIVSDAVSYLKSLAELRGRNAEWAEKAVRDAATLTASEALKEHVVDVVAGDLGELLASLDGRSYSSPDGVQTLAVKNALVVPLEPDWRARFLSVITDPNIAFIMLMIGIYGIVFEFWSPGLVGPGIIGGIALIVALMALSALPISFAGLALLLFGLALMIAEAMAPGIGLLGLGGVIAFALGAVFLFDPAGADIDFAIAWPLIISATLTSALLLIGLLGFVMRVSRARVVTGSEEMLGLVGRVASWAPDAYEGRIIVHGESWSARSTVPLTAGQQVKVNDRKDLQLIVTPCDERK
ncbi:nodulation protein NfeD [Hyphomicrobium sp. CS1GBMeth3]|uniref:NfeD family protein n=1 Tax=Hyphomicrobium sp. CS1GBMeth3 TaxID=1892845 RepID=UPI0009300764|nr:nodulation protein NfeD [Hyphomicrobium sp. CS1GBMeth3]